MDLEMNIHAADEDHPSLHVLMVERVRESVDELPPLPGQSAGAGNDPDGVNGPALGASDGRARQAK